MSKRLIVIVCSVAFAGILVIGIFLVFRKTPPRAARLLPEADAVVYLDVRPFRLATHFDRDSVTHSPEFQHFIDATGFVPERDLDSAGFALQQMADPSGPNGPVAYSEVLIGRFDGNRIARYLASLATHQEVYGPNVIFDIPVEGRTVRVTQLLRDTIAASNAPTPEQIHAIIDRNRSGFTLVQPSSLLAARYGDLPLLCPAWAVGRIGLPFNGHGHITFSGLELPVSAQSDFVASLHYTGSVHLRVEQIATSSLEAQRAVENLKTLLAVFRLVHAVPPVRVSDQPLLDIANTVEIERSGSRAVVTAEVPKGLFHQLAEASNTSGPSR